MNEGGVVRIGHLRWKIEYLTVAASCLLLGLIALHWLQPGNLIAQIDYSPPHDSWNGFLKCLVPWNHFRSVVGGLDPCYTFAPYFAFEGLLQHVLGDSLAEVILFGLPLIFGWLGVYRCTRALGVSNWPAALAAWAYSFNSFRQFSIGLWITAELFVALFPWIVYALIRAAAAPVSAQRRNATLLIAVSTFALLEIMASSPQLLVEFVAGCLAWFAVSGMTTDRERSYLRWGVRTFFTSAALSLWWSVPLVVAFLTQPLTRSLDPSANAWTFVRASLLNELRFNPSWVWNYSFYYPYNSAVDSHLITYTAGFLVILGFCGALILTQDKQLRIVRGAGAIALIMLFIAKGVHPPLASLNLLFYKLPGMSAFQETGGALIIAAFSLSLCSAFAFEAVRQRLLETRRRAAAVLATAAVLSAAFVSGAPIVSGAVFHEADDALPAMHVRLPATWLDLSAYLNHQPADGAILVLPSGRLYQADYVWGFRGFDLVAHQLLHRRVQLAGASLSYLSDARAQMLIQDLLDRIGAHDPGSAPALRRIGFRYVLWRGDLSQMTIDGENVRSLALTLHAGPHMFGDLALFDVGNPPAPVETSSSKEKATVEKTLGAPQALSALPARSSNMTFKQRRVLFRPGGPAPQGTPLPSVSARSDLADGIDFKIFNPAGAAISTDVEIGVPARLPASYRLATTQQTFTAAAARASHIVPLQFSAILLLPGDNDITLTSASQARLRWAELLPPRTLEPRFAAGRTYQLDFNNSVLAPPAGRFHEVESTEWAPLDLSAALHPVVSAQARPSGAEAWSTILAFRVQDHRYLCHLTLSAAPVALADSAASCLESSRIPAGGSSPATFTSLMIVRPVADRRSHTTDLPRSLSITVQESPKLFAAAPTLGGTTLPHAWLRDSVAIARLPAAFSGAIITTDLYSSTWLGVLIQPKLLPLRHIQVSGWRNAWVVPEGGLILMFNALALWEIVALLIGLITLTVMARVRN